MHRRQEDKLWAEAEAAEAVFPEAAAVPADIVEAVAAAEAVLAAAADEAVWVALAAAAVAADWEAVQAEAAWVAAHVREVEHVLAVQDQWEAPWAAADRRGDRDGDGSSLAPDIMETDMAEAAAVQA
ncbi:MAG: hypothetical protein LUC95_12420 [Lachnospiraceae bacterium]|nr:hypothetical protein [Lachnospiraceae bacterium]